MTEETNKAIDNAATALTIGLVYGLNAIAYAINPAAATDPMKLLDRVWGAYNTNKK